MSLDSFLARGFLPDWLIRIGIRRLNRLRLRDLHADNIEAAQAQQMQLVELLRSDAIAVLTDKANEQHYEVPAEFYALCLGAHRKYSSCYFPTGKESLDEAERLMLEETCANATLADGQQILELGCGWGSLSLWMAERYPHAKITSVSNSHSQREYINSEIKKRKIKNLKVITNDVNTFKPEQKFDRVVSVEMFEHMRNYGKLFRSIHGWLKPGGRLFVHIFTHRQFAYLFEDKDATDWMARYFFSGGIMPSNFLFAYFSEKFSLRFHRIYEGTHYHLTSELWLKNFDANRQRIEEIFTATYGSLNVRRFVNYWRIFFMAVSELFKTKKGQEWMVNHYLFEKK